MTFPADTGLLTASSLEVAHVQNVRRDVSNKFPILMLGNICLAFIYPYFGLPASF